MPVLILSSENKALENEIARKIAKKLGYTMLNRQALNEIADTYSLDRKKLKDAMKITPSILKRMPSKWWYYYLSCVELEVLDRLSKDNCVCWGLAAHLYLVVISHVFKVRLIGGHKHMPPSGPPAMTPEKMKKYIADQHRNREKWSMTAFKRKEADPELYDMVINLDQVPLEEAVETLAVTLGYPRFQAMTYSKTNLMDQTLAARVKNALLKSLTDIRVTSQKGMVVVTTTSVKREKIKKIDTIKEIASRVDGIGYLEVRWHKDVMTEAAMSSR